MLKWFSNLLPKSKATRLHTRTVVRARYDAASTTPDNRRHWANADGLSANAANSAEVRRVQLSRSA